jgi:molybdopterin converting factor subunit 1
MIVRVRLFAVAREIAGADAIELQVPAGASVRDVLHELVQQAPALSRVVAHSILAVDGEPANEDAAIGADAEVALIPPVSGG